MKNNLFKVFFFENLENYSNIFFNLYLIVCLLCINFKYNIKIKLRRNMHKTN